MNCCPDASSVIVKHRAKVFMPFHLLDETLCFESPDLLVEGIEQLLPGGSPGEGCAIVKCSSETAEIKVSFRGPVLFIGLMPARCISRTFAICPEAKYKTSLLMG